MGTVVLTLNSSPGASMLMRYRGLLRSSMKSHSSKVQPAVDVFSPHILVPMITAMRLPSRSLNTVPRMLPPCSAFTVCKRMLKGAAASASANFCTALVTGSVKR